MPQRSATLASLAILFLGSALQGAASAAPPNVVFILVDDLGWADVGCYGGEAFETPNIDRLAEEGVRFTDFYAACPVCSPTRAAIQSGQYQARLRITDFIPGHYRPFEKLVVPFNADHLPLTIETPAELLAAADYKSAYFGKWHLGNPPGRQPADQGYDVSEVFNGHYVPRRPKPNGEQEYATDYLARRAEDFIADNTENPFFLFLSPYAVHIPLQAKAETVGKYEQKLGGPSGPEGPLPSPVYAAMVEHVDDLVGSIVKTLEEKGLTENTLVIFTSDNGGLYKMYTGQGDRATDNGPLRGEKGTVYEGGIRVPLIVKWPGVAKAAATCDEPTISIDFWPTLAQAAGVGPNDSTQLIDGVSLLPLLTDPEESLQREAIFWHYPHYHHMDPAAAVRSGRWKLIRHFADDSVELYDLEADLSEENDRAAEEPDVVSRLSTLLDGFIAETDALLPTVNERYDSERASEWWNRRTGKPLDIEGSNSRWATQKK